MPEAEAGLLVLGVRVPGGRPALARRLAALAAWAAERIGRPVSLSYVLVDDRRMADLHVRTLGVEGPTDVLSFPYAERPRLEGEIVLSVETARREAAARGLEPADEVLLYAVHGTLHLVGHDDHDPADRRRMRAAERRLLARLGRAGRPGSGPGWRGAGQRG